LIDHAVNTPSPDDDSLQIAGSLLFLDVSAMNVSKLISLTLLCYLTTLLPGCALDPRDIFVKRDETIKQINSKDEVSAVVKAGKTLKKVVQEQRLKSEKSKSVSDYIDYYLIRQAAIEVLEGKINQATVGNSLSLRDDGQLESWVEELLDMDPHNRVAMGFLESQVPVDPRIKMLYQLAPTSKIAGNFNVSIYSSLIDDKALSKKKISDQFSLVSSSNRMSTEQILKLLAGDPKKIRSCRAIVADGVVAVEPLVSVDQARGVVERARGPKANSASSEPGVGSLAKGNVAATPADFMLGRCLNDIFAQYGLGFNLHNSASEAVSRQGVLPEFTISATSTIGDLLVWLAEEYNINFLLGFDRIAVFSGRDLPRDIEQDMYVYYVQTRYVPVMSVMNALAAAGYTRLATGMDMDHDVLWLSANIYDYLNAMQVISAVDAPTSQLKINMEILEVEQGLISEIGARIPQALGFALGDPVFRYYNYGTAQPLANQGIVSQAASTGSVQLSSLRHQKLDDVVRLIVRDEAFRLVARQQNYSIEISERPTLIMRSGDTSSLSIGSRLPVITTGISGGGAVSESVTMLDLGMNIDVTANVLDNQNVGLKVSVKVSHLLNETKSERGTTQPHLSTRNLSTALVVEDGKTVMLGGVSILSNKNTKDGIPGLANNGFTVMAGGSQAKDQKKNDLLLLITPEITTPQLGLLHAMRKSRFGEEKNPSLSSVIQRSLENYINTSATQQANARANTPQQGVRK
jgi:type II secretory pathway component GspD/PulD (secretin)